MGGTNLIPPPRFESRKSGGRVETPSQCGQIKACPLQADFENAPRVSELHSTSPLSFAPEEV